MTKKLGLTKSIRKFRKFILRLENRKTFRLYVEKSQHLLYEGIWSEKKDVKASRVPKEYQL